MLRTLTFASSFAAFKMRPNEGTPPVSPMPGTPSLPGIAGPKIPDINPGFALVARDFPKNIGTSVPPIFAAKPPAAKTFPYSKLSSTLTSKIAASTKTCFLLTSNFSITRLRFLKSLKLDTITSEFVASFADIFISPSNTSAPFFLFFPLFLRLFETLLKVFTISFALAFCSFTT